MAMPWLEPLLDDASARLAAGRLPHALILSGPDGWGEAVLANALALRILGVGEDRDAAALAHPDLRWLVPEGTGIRVDAVRALAAFAQGTPQSGTRKVGVLAEAHRLNASAANALLKTLEEPPPGTHLLLSTCYPGRLAATIRSRSQNVVIRPDAAAARRWLEAEVPGADLERVLFEHGGAPVAVRDALRAGEEPLHGLLEAALDDRGRAGPVVDSLLASGLAAALPRWYRYVLALAAGRWTPPALRERVAGRAIQAFVDELLWARRLLAVATSPNERLIAERLVARWRRLRGPAA